MTQTPNPYGSLLGNRDPKEVMAGTPQRLRALTAELGKKADVSYSPGKWTARQILSHLTDCEIAFAFRLRQAVADTDHVIQPFDQDGWAQHCQQSDPAQAVEVFCALRGWNLAFLNHQPAETMSKALRHPERGAMTFEILVRTIGGHDLNHLSQLETIAGQS